MTEITAARIFGLDQGRNLLIVAEVVLYGREHRLEWCAHPWMFEDWGADGVASLACINWEEMLITSPGFGPPGDEETPFNRR